jgi:hypothetical protein
MGLDSSIFHQNNDPKQTSHHSNRHFEYKGIDLLPLYSQSPDLDPIENLWPMIDGKLSKLIIKSKSELKSALEDIWYLIPKKNLPDISRKLKESYCL